MLQKYVQDQVAKTNERNLWLFNGISYSGDKPGDCLNVDEYPCIQAVLLIDFQRGLKQSLFPTNCAYFNQLKVGPGSVFRPGAISACPAMSVIG